MKALLPLCGVLAMASCSPMQTSNVGERTSQVATKQTTLTAAEKARIGKKIWQNESGGSVNGLTAWNEGEAFPSLGIGHFIWYPTGTQGPYTESFPQFIAYAKQRGANPPAVASSNGSPWPNRTRFMGDFNGPRLKGMRTWLSNNVPLQTDFIIAKSRASLPKILRAAGPDAARVQANYDRVATTATGQYALIDYVNFKGEGINPNERYQGQGWGLLQVLQEMRGNATGQAAAQEFSRAASAVMARRVANSGGKDTRWREGWLNRTRTYGQAL